jgi:ubiquinone/menaquinone biosynthesis C-methylase UbiE
VPQPSTAAAPLDHSKSLPAELPDYADALLSYHRSHAETLEVMISRLPITAGQSALDVATGDGTYGILMAQRGADVVVLDQDPNYLSLATSRAVRRGLHLDPVSGDARNLPFEDDHFDGVFCAQSFYSISNVSRVISEMRRVVKPGGWLGILENDSLHHVLLPWPPDLELAVRLGQYTALAGATPNETSPKGERYYIGRRLFSVLYEAEFEAVQQASFATQHTAPLSEDAHTFLREHAVGIVEQARPHLPPGVLQAAVSSCDPASADYLFTQPDFSATVLDLLVWGVKPRG